MKYDVRFTKAAEDNLTDIFDYICNVLKSSKEAHKLITQIEAKVNSLDYMPERHQRIMEEPWFSSGFRMVTVKNYIIAYVIDHKGKVVYVFAVFYNGRDYRSTLNKYMNEENIKNEMLKSETNEAK